MTAPLITLNDGNEIPSVGLGVYQTPREATEQAVSAALQAGYRHIDTAAAYGNERETGKAIAKSPIPREDVFVVTKLSERRPGLRQHDVRVREKHGTTGAE